jgi:hypothetical protein
MQAPGLPPLPDILGKALAPPLFRLDPGEAVALGLMPP